MPQPGDIIIWNTKSLGIVIEPANRRGFENAICVNWISTPVGEHLYFRDQHPDFDCYVCTKNDTSNLEVIGTVQELPQ